MIFGSFLLERFINFTKQSQTADKTTVEWVHRGYECLRCTFAHSNVRWEQIKAKRNNEHISQFINNVFRLQLFFLMMCVYETGR